MKLLDDERNRLKYDMNRTLEMEREKLRAMQRLDIEHKDQ